MLATLIKSAHAQVRIVAANILSRRHARRHKTLYRFMISRDGFADMEEFILNNAISLNAPVALISQIERSGGTLLSQLFDGHPHVAAYPHELRFGYRERDSWPSSIKTFADVADLKMQMLMKHGFRKGRHGQARRFLFSPRVQKLLFEASRKQTNREAFNVFFTSFFNAWLDYQGNLSDKTLITAFSPRLANSPENVRRFFCCYPDGYLIQITREFDSWWRSAANQYGENRSQQRLRRAWDENIANIEHNKKRYGDRVLVLSFDGLRHDTEATMRELCKWLPIEFNDCLKTPTFNGEPAWANSSFAVQGPGLLAG